MRHTEHFMIVACTDKHEYINKGKMSPFIQGPMCLFIFNDLKPNEITDSNIYGESFVDKY